MKHLDAWAWDNVPDTRDDVPAEAIIETMRIGLTSSWYAHPCDALMLRDGLQSIFDYGDIHEVMCKSTLSRILAVDDNLQDWQLSAEMQINDLPPALLYWVQSRLLFRRPNQVPYGREYNAHYNADYNTEYNAISVPKLHHREYSQMRSQLRLGVPELHNYDDNWRLQLTSKSSPSNWCSQRSYLRLVAGGATTFKWRGWLYRNRNPYRKHLPYWKCRNDAPYDPVTNWDC